MPLEPTDRLGVTMTPEEWASICIEVLQGATFDTARPIVGQIVGNADHVTRLTAVEWNEILAILRNGRYSVVAPLIQKVVMQATNAQMMTAPPPPQPNGIDSGEQWPEHEVEAPTPVTRNRRQANIEANAQSNRD
jgi:hypothetical protein